MGVALWSACPLDWDGTPSACAGRLEAQFSARAGAEDPSRGAAGAVLCLQQTLPAYLEPARAAGRPPHDALATAAAALAALAARGCAAVTLSQLTGPHGARAQPTEIFPT